jgi:hypothetical protein
MENELRGMVSDEEQHVGYPTGSNMTSSSDERSSSSRRYFSQQSRVPQLVSSWTRNSLHSSPTSLYLLSFPYSPAKKETTLGVCYPELLDDPQPLPPQLLGLLIPLELKARLSQPSHHVQRVDMNVILSCSTALQLPPHLLSILIPFELKA